MKRIRFTSFTMFLLIVLMMAGAPVQAGGSQGISRAIAANPFAQLIDTAAETWLWLMAEDPAGSSGGETGQATEKTDSTPPPSGSATTTGGGITPPGGGCIDPNGKPC